MNYHISWMMCSMAFVAGCAVGPDFKSPAAPIVDRFTQAEPIERTVGIDAKGGEIQWFRSGEEISPQWWTLYESKVLDRLMVDALQRNFTLKAAQAALRAAQLDVRAGRGQLFPSVD